MKTEDNLVPKMRDEASTPEVSHILEPGQVLRVTGVVPGVPQEGQSAREGLPLLHAQKDVWKEVGGEWNLEGTFTLFFLPRKLKNENISFFSWSDFIM